MENRFMKLSDRYMDIAEDFADVLNDTNYEDLVEWFGGEDEAYEFIKFYDEISDFSRYLRDIETN